MRYKLKENPPRGSKRITELYLYFPLLLDNEWRWLETAKIEEIFTFKGWSFVKWVNK